MRERRLTKQRKSVTMEATTDDAQMLTLLVANEMGLLGENIRSPEVANELIATISRVECGVECCVKTHEELKKLAILAVNVVKLGLVSTNLEEMDDFPPPFGEETQAKSPFEYRERTKHTDFGAGVFENEPFVVDSPLERGESDEN